MENNSATHHHAHAADVAREVEWDATRAQDQLDALTATRASLAGRLVTPRWYHPALGALVGALVLGQLLPEPGPLLVLVVYSLGLAALVAAYRRGVGAWSSGWGGRRSRPWLWALAAIVVPVVLTSLGARSGRLPAWVAVVGAVVAFLAFVVIGPRFDAALRADVRDDG